MPEVDRSTACAKLAKTNFMENTNPLFMHGRLYEGPMLPPKCIWDCKKPPRDDHAAPRWLTASEFQDEEAALIAKVRQLAALMRVSKKTVLYTGAGISASAIGQAARSGQNTQGWKGDTRAAKPTPTHFALGLLGQQGLVHGWVQQNHDGLPQKAGFPQEKINEIHGSWYDPSNPVVKYSGSLHERAYPWMEDDAETADLVLVLGTSLGGLNADQVATNAAQRSITSREGALGTVCINLQQTDQDGIMTLRFFGRSDDVTRLLLRELGFPSARLRPPAWPKESRALVPYDAEGRRLPKGERRWMWLDLSDRQKVRITPGHNIQGARQPQYMHIGASKSVTVKGTTRKPGEGLGCVVSRQDDTSSFVLDIEGAQMRLGIWWLEAAMRGGPDVLPVVNQRPVFEDAKV
jgi:NAD-dependent SIR2 family protein deacetylase